LLDSTVASVETWIVRVLMAAVLLALLYLFFGKGEWFDQED